MKLFGKKVEPSCSYCENGKSSADGSLVLCYYRGVVEPHQSCRKFVYSPFKRIPRRNRPLQKFSKKDFEL